MYFLILFLSLSNSFFFFFLTVLVFEYRASCLPGRHSPTQARSQPFLLWLFWDRVSLCKEWPEPWSSCLCFLYNWDDRCTHMPSFYWLRLGLANFWSGLPSNCDSSDLCLPCEDYRRKSVQALDHKFLIFLLVYFYGEELSFWNMINRIYLTFSISFFF
jgi:hypothetical protein